MTADELIALIQYIRTFGFHNERYGAKDTRIFDITEWWNDFAHTEPGVDAESSVWVWHSPALDKAVDHPTVWIRVGGQVYYVCDDTVTVHLSTATLGCSATRMLTRIVQHLLGTT